VLTVNKAIVLNLIIVGGTKCTLVRRAVTLQLSVNLNFTIQRILIACSGFFVHKADNRAFNVVCVELTVLVSTAPRSLCIPCSCIFEGWSDFMGSDYLQLISLRCLICRFWLHLLNYVLFQEFLLGHIRAD